MRLTAQAKFDFNAQSSKQLGFKKGQIVIITKEINKDWYEGETADRKSSGMFPVAYVEVGFLLTNTGTSFSLQIFLDIIMTMNQNSVTISGSCGVWLSKILPPL